MRGGMQGLLAQAQKMQKEVQKAQDELAHTEVTGVAGNGLVAITMTCNSKPRSVKIDEKLFTGDAAEDKEMIEDLVLAALTDAQARIAETSKARMAAATAGMPLPPGMKLPF